MRFDYYAMMRVLVLVARDQRTGHDGKRTMCGPPRGSRDDLVKNMTNPDDNSHVARARPFEDIRRGN